MGHDPYLILRPLTRPDPELDRIIEQMKREIEAAFRLPEKFVKTQR